MSKVLVIGDGCKDVFQYGKCERLSPEAPVPVFKPTNSKENGGMAVNVYNNLMALGVDCDIHTYSGISKTRYIDEVSNQMLLRIDEHDQIFVGVNIYERQMAFDYSQYDAIVISDYDKGFLSEEVIKHIAISNPLTFMDTKKKIGNWATFIKYIKINKKEFDQNENYLTLHFPNETIVTLGADGAKRHYREDGHGKIQYYPNVNEHPVRDLTGAGDTFLAGLVAGYLEKNNIDDAIIFANKCAAWAVTQKGVSIVDRYKIQ
jgi:D-beta-D-heptose 7-phosphate kinase/D-beta-D-heptose 1-phosphate adenosyltransferase